MTQKCVVFLFQLDDTETKIMQIDCRSCVHFHFTNNTAKKWILKIVIVLLIYVLFLELDK